MDVWLAELSGAELKVLLYLVRRTVGFHRDRARVGMRQICSGIPGKDLGTGLHIDTVVTVITSLEARGLLVCERKPGRRTTYVPRIKNSAYGKSEHPTTEKPNTQAFGKSEHKERKSSSSETKIKKENVSSGSVQQIERTPSPQQTSSKPNRSRFDDDEKTNTPEPITYASPEDELRSIYRSKAGQDISRDLLNRICDTCELHGVSLSRFVDELRPHVPNHWKNPAGFLTDFARKIASNASGSSTARRATLLLTVKETPRCSKCRGIGRVNGGYCDCPMGRDLQRVEQSTPAPPVSEH
jgi:Penicillinase repressor